ncbi:MAG: spore coat protein [Clostridiales bacterium]|jgi:spore coat protein CotF|nr:spore coat protein [Clostridiales bacterium]
MITNVNLTTKEKFLLEDMKSHEEQCILKYDNYQSLACDPQLKAVFRSNAQIEREHLQTINQLLNGKVPAMGGGQQQQGPQQNANQSQQATQQSSFKQETTSSLGFNISDKDMCMDMLSTEKYVSGAYDTAIFEFKDAQVRDVLNHIQKEEQKHGQAISAYMISKGMYSPK